MTGSRVRSLTTGIEHRRGWQPLAWNLHEVDASRQAESLQGSLSELAIPGEAEVRDTTFGAMVIL